VQINPIPKLTVRMCSREHVGLIGSAIIGSMWAWRRPYSDPFRVLTGFFVLFGSAFASVVFGLLVLNLAVRHRESLGAGALVVVPVAVWLTLAWRFHRTALVVGDTGVRVRWLLKTRTIPWDDIDGFWFGEDILGTDRLWIGLKDGRRIRTPIQRVARLIGGSRLSDGGTWLRSGDCDELLRDLEHELWVWRVGARPGSPQ
jgi:hypothetical protein